MDNETIGRTLAWGLLFVGTFVLAARREEEEEAKEKVNSKPAQ